MNIAIQMILIKYVKYYIKVNKYMDIKKQTKNWNKEDIVNKFAEKCASLNIGRKEILSYI